jgi:hypothetical protein
VWDLRRQKLVVMTSLDERRDEAPGSPPSLPGERTGPGRRRWPWIVGGAVLLIGGVSLAFWLTTSRARPVSMREAESQLGSQDRGSSGSSRPAPGVYEYTGSGTEQLSLPPLSQTEGRPMPGTVTLQGSNCWVFKIDYSTHHWQTWRYCLHADDLWEAGGQSWQLWSIGPINVTNVSSFTCVARSMALPGRRTPGEVWQSRCTGTNTSVKGTTVSAGPYRFLGNVTISVGRTRVLAARFLRLRTDSGTQRGTERSEVWFDARNGLILRLQQDIKVTSPTLFGTSTYTQRGVFAIESLVPHH